MVHYNNVPTDIVGNCTNSADPDIWFPEFTAGTPHPTTVQHVAYQVNYALSECATCPAKESCLDEGMRPENLAYGIWGGLLAGERLALIGHSPDEFYEGDAEKIAFNVLKRVRPLLRR